jgi:DNA polymerase delta subunit 4
MSEAQIKKFWRDQESLRLVPRVHQEDLDVHERVLRLWDVSGQYGVSDICWRLF